MCCCQGKVMLPLLSPTPPILVELLRSDSQHAKDFRKNIRSYNSALSLTSTGVNFQY
ncbi:uncharacterized protein BYT42DRAFT_558739 [Radiomyces spectabilis]|uniref:uncharacterized protein n=1 Tax=Radiomyces spectabilis TaxID=64574 RepID=UPI00221E4949|nr:uncharacterized protein BYT42DRAFT_558739 [Radiomyces spectabilis]KAI8388043.1 hypothetical protein BYT42DRAFT_558739 [Radiomyces spectabilis]